MAHWCPFWSAKAKDKRFQDGIEGSFCSQTFRVGSYQHNHKCRDKHFCPDLKYINLILEREKLLWQKEKKNLHTQIQQFPGYLDRGTPIIIEQDRKRTIIGIFQERLNEKYRFTSWALGGHHDYTGPYLFSKIDPDAFNWIVNYADWTHDSKCTDYTSCSCGIEGKQVNDNFNNK